jgi:proteic killer suppression protein
MSLEVRFQDASLDRLETDTSATGGYPPGVVRAFRKRMQIIRAAPDERVFYEWKSLHFEKLKGDRSHQHSVRLNDQWRLIIEFQGEAPNKTILIVGIEDYH